MTRPANTVGGDFYDVLPLIDDPDGRVIVTIGDVAGKGSPAALLMALLLAVLRTLVDEELEARALVARLNTQICRHSPGSRFITLFYGVYTPSTGALTYVNAGQNPPLLRRADGSIERLGGTGVALGMFEGSTYEAVDTRASRRANAGAVQRRHHRGGESRRAAVRGERARARSSSVTRSGSRPRWRPGAEGGRAHAKGIALHRRPHDSDAEARARRVLSLTRRYRTRKTRASPSTASGRELLDGAAMRSAEPRAKASVLPVVNDQKGS